MGFVGRLIGRIFGRGRGGEDSEFLSIVFLLNRVREVDEPGLQERVGRMVKERMSMEGMPEMKVGELKPGVKGLAIEGMPVAVMSVAMPYTEKSPAELTTDLRLQRVLEKHVAWIACDWMMGAMPGGKEGEKMKVMAYRIMGQVMAEVGEAIGGDCIVGVYDKGSGKLAPFRAGTLDQLAGEFPESAFEMNEAPILSSEGKEEALAAATAEAQRRLPEFVAALERRKGEMFGVKAKFEDEHGTEWMWVAVERVEGEGEEMGFEGRLDNSPDTVKSVKAGDRVRVKVEEVVDWVYRKGDEMEGGFSVKVFQGG